jgi:predicted N-acetyltransferase YhbS
MKIKIRNEEAKDFEQVRAILRGAFPTEAESKLVNVLRANGKASSRWLQQIKNRCWVISFSALSPPPHRAKPK